MLEKRENTIREALKKSEEAQIESERVLAEYNKQLADAKAQSAQIIADARSVGEAVKADITAQAQTEAADMIAKAKAAIEAEKKQAISELQATVADAWSMWPRAPDRRGSAPRVSTAPSSSATSKRRVVSMATNRLVVKEEVAVYASVLSMPPIPAGGQEAVLEVREQMGEIIRLMRADLELTQSLSNPDFTPAQRKELVEGVFADCHLALREVLAVMAERGQADRCCRGSIDAYRKLLGDKLGICVVDVTTAVPLDDGLRQLITEKAEADLGRRAVLRERIDASILGGIIMDVDGNYIDASMISQLNRARNVLKDTTDGGEC